MYTKIDLLHDIESLEIDPKGTLLIHSSMKAIGPVEGGADTVLDAWSEYMRDGLLIFPTHTWRQIGKETLTFDSRSLPSCVGILPELFRHRPGVVRSLHPTHSVAALGKGAITYTAGEETRVTPCPREGCWGKLLDLDAEILFLGCTLRSNTFLHGVEEWEEIPDRLDSKTQSITIIGPNGETYHVEMHRHNCLACDDVSENYIKMEPVFLKHGAIRYGRFGDAKCVVGNARKMRELTVEMLHRDPNLFITPNPVPESWYERSGIDGVGNPDLDRDA